MTCDLRCDRIRDLRYDRSRFVLEHLRQFQSARDELKSAPMEVRRLGLPLAIAGWAQRPNSQRLVPLVSEWLFKDWGMLRAGSPPPTAVALLRALEELAKDAPMVRSAAEIEAEELLQAAKVLTDGANRDGAAP